MTDQDQFEKYAGKDRRVDKFFNLSIDLLCIATTDGYFKEVNPAFLKTLGYTKEELTRVQFMEFLHPEDVESTLHELQKLSKGNTTRQFENRYLCKNGEYKWLSWTSVPDPASGLLYAVARDLTESKKTELALRQSADKLRIQTKSLEEKNLALQEVLKQIDIEKQQMKMEIKANVEELVIPSLQKLKRKGSAIDQRQIEVLENSLRAITAPFGILVSDERLKLTPKEIEICNMIKNGLSSKEIAQITSNSQRTIENHRNHIRSKLNLAGKGINLVTYLQSL